MEFRVLQRDVDSLRQREKNLQEPGFPCKHMKLERYHATLNAFENMNQELSKTNCPIETLELSQIVFNDKRVDLLADAIRQNSSIQHIELNKCKIRKNQIEKLAMAVASNEELQAFKMKHANICHIKAAQIANLMKTHVGLKQLTLVEAGLGDRAMTALSEGIAESTNLQILDLRCNVFEEVGFTALINALKQIWTPQELHLEGLRILNEQAKILGSYLEDKRCQINVLSLHEAEFCEFSLKTVLDSLIKGNKLKRISLAKNELDLDACKSVVKLMKAHYSLESLCLAHCNLQDETWKVLADGMISTNIKYLNISWNDLNEESMGSLCKLLRQQSAIEKLLIQHNNFGSKAICTLTETLKTHCGIKYLDVSANQIKTQGLVALIKMLTADNTGKFHQLHTLQCRKNEIEADSDDSKVFNLSRMFKQLINNPHLSVINLQDNELSAEDAQELLDYCKKNIFIEELVLEGNTQVPHSLIVQIQEECRENLLIREMIVPKLPLAKDTNFLSKRITNNCFKGFDTRAIEFSDQSFYTVDFIAKFIEMNKIDFEQLKLVRVYSDRNLKSLANYFQTGNRNLRVLYLEQANFSAANTQKIIVACRKLTHLQELHLVKLQGLNNHTDTLAAALKDSKMLTKLDIRDNYIAEYKYIAELLATNQHLEKLDLRGNEMDEDKIETIWLGLHDNISLYELQYDKEEKNLEQVAEDCIQTELLINKFIIENIISRATESTHDLNLSNFRLSNNGITSMSAVIKFIKNKRVTSLDLTNTDIDHEQISMLAARILEGGIYLNTLKLARNNQVDNKACKTLSVLLHGNACLRHLDCSYTNIDKDGLKVILNGCKKSTTISNLNFELCRINLEKNADMDEVVEAMTANTSITELNLKGSIIEERARSLIEEEMKMNELIVEHIYPVIQQQELERVRKYEQLQEKQKERRFRRASKKMSKHKIDFQKSISQTDKGNRRSVIEQPGKFGGLNTVQGVSFARDQKRTSRTVTFDFNQKYDMNQSDANMNQDLNFSQAALSEQDDPIDEKESRKSDAVSRLSRATTFQSQTFDLKLKGKNIQSLKFLTKFMREFPKIGVIDLGDNKISEKEMSHFAQSLKSNKFLQSVNVGNTKGIAKDTKALMKRELEKNKQIQDVVDFDIGDIEHQRTISALDLQGKNIRDIGFLQKMLPDFSVLSTLDLSNNNLRDSGAKQISEMLLDNPAIKTLILRNNRITSEGLKHICSALSNSKCNVRSLDIEDNLINDDVLKVLLALLQQNEKIDDIKFSLSKEKNIDRQIMFDKISHLPADAIRAQLLHHQHEKLACWKKVILPYWFWCWMMEAKHEAFAFKYDTKQLNIIEQEHMKWCGIGLYVNSFIYYMIVILCPIVFVKPCGEGLNYVSHYIYGAYAVLNAAFEIAVVCRIQSRLHNKELLSFNRWHAVELIMGQIARFDTYLDVCFLSLVVQCEMWYMIYPIAVFIAIFMIYPVLKMFLLCKVKKDMSHTLPLIERNCQLAFIRENMLLATVLDSFCIENYVSMCRKPIVFGKIMGAWTFFFQDFPQTFIHLYFLIFIHDKVPHSDKTVKLSLFVSCLAICVSFFNFVMCAPNDFDPILLLVELKLRKERRNKQVLNEEKIKALEQKQSFKDNITKRGSLFLRKASSLLVGQQEKKTDQKLKEKTPSGDVFNTSLSRPSLSEASLRDGLGKQEEEKLSLQLTDHKPHTPYTRHEMEQGDKQPSNKQDSEQSKKAIKVGLVTNDQLDDMIITEESIQSSQIPAEGNRLEIVDNSLKRKDPCSADVSAMKDNSSIQVNDTPWGDKVVSAKGKRMFQDIQDGSHA